MEYVVLAAGRSQRMGFDKVVALGARSPLARIARALVDRPSVVVVPAHLAAAAAAAMPSARIAVNDEPARGMTHSLLVGLRLVACQASFGVLLGDMPAMTEAALARTEMLLAHGVDVAYPVDVRGTPGHPVLFSARARAVVEALPQGDTLRHARDDESLQRATWRCDDRAAFLDVDVPDEWRAFFDT